VKRIKLSSLKIRNFERFSDDEFLNYRYKYRNQDESYNDIDILYYEKSRIEKGLYSGDRDEDITDILNGIAEDIALYYQNKNNYFTKVEAAKLLKCDPRKIDQYYRKGCIRAELGKTTRGIGENLRYCKQDVFQLLEEINGKRRS
jgi:hypothetical protein